MICSASDISIAIPDGYGEPTLGSFGIPHAIQLPPLGNLPSGQPEDLQNLFNILQMLVPSNVLKPNLLPNSSKDVSDGFMSLMDQFAPFLYLYKFFLPVLNIVICIIEVLCSISNPIKMAQAMRKLFRTCIPEFLNLFPIFAVIVMIISLLLLLLTVVEYILSQLLKLISVLLRNVNALTNSFQEANDQSVLAIAQKIGGLLCSFQNLFVMLGIFNTIINVIKDILKTASSIPPCDNSSGSDCCDSSVCPPIVQQNYTRSTGSFQYFNEVAINTGVALPPPMNTLNVDLRVESWQIYDINQLPTQRFSEIYDGYDITTAPIPIFFPVDATYNAKTAPAQAAYTIDLRFFYDPHQWGRVGVKRYVQFKDCIVQKVPSPDLITYNNNEIPTSSGVISLVGGSGYEDNGTTILNGFASDGTTQIAAQATLENFIHFKEVVGTSPTLSSTDGYLFSNIEYTFKPNQKVLQNKSIITLGCEDQLAADKGFVNAIYAGDIGIKTQELNNLLDTSFPDILGAEACLNTALNALRNDITPVGVANFQTMVTVCLQKLKDDATNSLINSIALGFDPCKSSFALDPVIQFTTLPIIINVNINDKNSISLIEKLPVSVSDALAPRIKAYPTFGNVDAFVYDGYGTFTANLTSNLPGKGQMMISFDNNIFCTNTIPSDLSISPTHTLQTVDYQFIYTTAITPNKAIGDLSDNAPRRDELDQSTQGEI